MLNKVRALIDRYRLLRRDGRYLVALSGGADSVALLLVLQELGYQQEAVHCNFRLRGPESDRDEQFVTELCRERDISLHRAHFDTRGYAELHHVSIEMAARELRYRYFEQLRQDLAMDAICVAHHGDDVAETVLLNLIRGTGLRGLQGIRPKNGYVVRPLLSVSRKDVEQYLKDKQQPYVTDSTNLETDALRNKIRLNVMPQLRAVNPKAAENIRWAARCVADALSVYDEAIERQRREAVVEESDEGLKLDMRKVSSESLLFELLKPYGFSAAVTCGLASQRHETGRLFSSQEYDAVVDREYLVVRRRTAEEQPLVLPECGTYCLTSGVKLTLAQFERDATFQPSKEQHLVHVDGGKVRFPLTVRRVQEGDWFVPFGMTGRKLVSDFLTDRKVNLLDKRKALVVCDATNAVVWLVGYRTDNRFRVSDETESVLIIHSST